MFRHRSVTTALAVLFLTAPLAAQGVTPAPTDSVVAAVAAPVSSAPTTANASVGIHRTSTAPALGTATPAPQGSVGRNPAMMIVGGVALLVGAVVGGESGTIIMIGGGVLGIYGLWQYLK